MEQGPADVTVDAPLGSPPLFARAGGLVPMLPEGIDTLVDATAPGVVSLASRKTEMAARAWPSGTSSVVLDDGSAIVVQDGSAGVTVSWEPSGLVQNLTIDVDIRMKTGSSASIQGVSTVSGAPLAPLPLSGAAAVQASPSSAWSSGAPGHFWLRFVGPGVAVLQ